MTADRAPAADVVERLRSGKECGDPCKVREARSGCLCAEAAGEIEHLRWQLDYFGKLHSEHNDRQEAEIERLRAQPASAGLDPATVEAIWRKIDEMIHKGPLPGNGCDRSAERNGLVLAANAIRSLLP